MQGGEGDVRLLVAARRTLSRVAGAHATGSPSGAAHQRLVRRRFLDFGLATTLGCLAA